MAGIGEASAIVAVAQAGICLSRTIIAFIGDVRDAPNTVVRIGNEIQTTSGRLREIGALIEDNKATKLFSNEGVSDAARCSYECDLILAQVGNLLIKGGWKKDTQALDKSDIDLSLFSTLRWPFLKSRLESPRAELQIIKADLNLLFSSAMARRSSNPLTSPFAQDIPRLTRTREWAARKAERARQASRTSIRDEDVQWQSSTPDVSKGIRSHSKSSRMDDDPEIYQQFVAFEQQKVKEREDRKAQERAAILQAEIEKKREEEEKLRKMIELRAVENYKRQQEEIQQQQHARETALREQMASLGLEHEQIDSIIAMPGINSANIPNLTRASAASNAGADPDENQAQSPFVPQGQKRMEPEKRNSVRGFLGLSRYDSQVSDIGSQGLLENSAPDIGVGKSNNDMSSGLEFEHWLLDFVSRQHTELAVSRQWMDKKLSRLEKRDDVWQRIAELQPIWRAALQDFLTLRNRSELPETLWKPIDVSLPKRAIRPNIFSYRRDSHLIRLILCRRCSKEQDVKPSTGSQRSLLARTHAGMQTGSSQSAGEEKPDSQLPPEPQPFSEDPDAKSVSKQRKGVTFAPNVSSAGVSQSAAGKDDGSSADSYPEDNTADRTKPKGFKIPSVYITTNDEDNRHLGNWVTYLPRDYITVAALNSAALKFYKDFPKPTEFPEMVARDYFKVQQEVDPDLCAKLFEYSGGAPKHFDVYRNEPEYRDSQLEKPKRVSSHKMPTRPSLIESLKDIVDTLDQHHPFSIIEPPEDEELRALNRRLKSLSERIKARPSEFGSRNESIHIREGSIYDGQQRDRRSRSPSRSDARGEREYVDFAEFHPPKSRRASTDADTYYSPYYVESGVREQSDQMSRRNVNRYQSPPNNQNGSAYWAESPWNSNPRVDRYTDDHRRKPPEFGDLGNGAFYERTLRRESPPINLRRRSKDNSRGSASKNDVRRPGSSRRSNTTLFSERRPTYEDDDGIRVWAETEERDHFTPANSKAPKLLAAAAWEDGDSLEYKYRRAEDSVPYSPSPEIIQSPPPIQPRTNRSTADRPEYGFDQDEWRTVNSQAYGDGGITEFGPETPYLEHSKRTTPYDIMYETSRRDDLSRRRSRRSSSSSDSFADDEEPALSARDQIEDRELITKTLQKYTNFRADNTPKGFPPQAISSDKSEPEPLSEAVHESSPNELKANISNDRPKHDIKVIPISVRFAEDGTARDAHSPQHDYQGFAGADGSSFSRQTTFDTTVSSSTNDTDTRGAVELNPYPGSVSEEIIENGAQEKEATIYTDATRGSVDSKNKSTANGHPVDDDEWGFSRRKFARTPKLHNEKEEQGDDAKDGSNAHG